MKTPRKTRESHESIRRSVNRKGQVTIPKELRGKLGASGKVQVLETEEGILLKTLPRPEDDFGSLTKLFRGMTAREVVDEAGAKDRVREKRLLERVQNEHRQRQSLHPVV